MRLQHGTNNPHGEISGIQDPINWSEKLTASGGYFTPTGKPRALMVDVGGNVTIEFQNGQTDTLALVGGVWHPITWKRVVSATTTATGIHAGY